MDKLLQLQVWKDPVARAAAENMAVDEWLLRQVSDFPMIRFYRWIRPSLSFGYFESHAAATQQVAEPDLDVVRRWTGGGVVDHRGDVTYSLMIPRGHAWASLRGAESYRRIHLAVVEMFRGLGKDVELTSSDADSESIACFEKPVTYDVVDGQGEKLAGAGQRRTRWGLLHQGSLQGINQDSNWEDLLVEALCVSCKWAEVPQLKRHLEIVALTEKYSSAAWLQKR